MNNAITPMEPEIERARRYWLADNPGVITKIAVDVGCSQPYVSDIFYGRRPGNTGQGLDVRNALAAAGAPGFTEE